MKSVVDSFMKVMMVMMTLVMACGLASCELDDDEPLLTTQEKMEYGQLLSGNYSGRYLTLYGQDTYSNDVKRKEMENAVLVISDYTGHQIIFQNYPVSLLANVFEEGSELNLFFKNLSDIDITGSYTLYGVRDVDSNKVNVVFNYEINPILLQAEVNGEVRHLTLNITSNMNYLLSKADLANPIDVPSYRLRADVGSIYEGDTCLATFVGEDCPIFILEMREE